MHSLQLVCQERNSCKNKPVNPPNSPVIAQFWLLPLSESKSLKAWCGNELATAMPGRVVTSGACWERKKLK